MRSTKELLDKDRKRQHDERAPIEARAPYERRYFVEPFNDDPLYGIFHFLKLYETCTTKMLELMGLWGWRRWNDIIRVIRKKCPIKDLIVENGVEKYNKSNRVLIKYSLNKSFKNMPLEELVTMVLNSMCQSTTFNNMGINDSEEYTRKKLNKIVPGWFKFTGTDRNYRIHNLIPDFVDEKRGLVVEFLGPHHFKPFIKEPSHLIHVETKQYKYRKKGYEMFPITYKNYATELSEKELDEDLKLFLETFENRSLDEEIKKIKKKPFLNVSSKPVDKKEILYAL